MDILNLLFDAAQAANPVGKVKEKWIAIKNDPNLKNCAIGHQSAYADRDRNWEALKPFDKSVEIGKAIAQRMIKHEPMRKDDHDDADLRYLCDVGIVSLSVDNPHNGLFDNKDYEDGGENFRRIRIVGAMKAIEQKWVEENPGEKNEKYWTVFYSQLFNMFQTIPDKIEAGQNMTEAKLKSPNTSFNNMVDFIFVSTIYYSTLWNARPVVHFADEEFIDNPTTLKFKGMLDAIKQMPQEKQDDLKQKMKIIDGATGTGVYSFDGQSYNNTARTLANALIEHETSDK